MLLTVLACLLLPDIVSLPHESAEEPQGLRISQVKVDRYNDSSARVTVTGRYAGFDKGRVYFDLTIKKGLKELVTKRGYLDVVPRQNFERTFHITLSHELKGTRAFFKFGELRVQ